jgi:hypothetical protein
MTQDWSNFLFSAQGAYPNFLPDRFRLPDNLTRYSISVTLEDIHKAGYIGPIDIPVIKETEETLLWDSVACCYKVIPMADEKIKAHENQVINLKTQAEYLLATKDNTNKFISVYPHINMFNSASYNEFYCKLKEIVDTTYLYDDLPEFPALQLMDEQTEKELLKEYAIVLDSQISLWEDIYTKYGVDESKNYLCASGIFNIPDTWVKGSEPYTSSV